MNTIFFYLISHFHKIYATILNKNQRCHKLKISDINYKIFQLLSVDKFLKHCNSII